MLITIYSFVKFVYNVEEYDQCGGLWCYYSNDISLDFDCIGLVIQCGDCIICTLYIVHGNPCDRAPITMCY